METELENLYQLARMAKDENNYKNAAKYYEMILIKVPNDWEAAFYSEYYKTAACKMGEISSACNSLLNRIKNVLELPNCPQTRIIDECSALALNLYAGVKLSFEKSSATDKLATKSATIDCYMSIVAFLYLLGDHIEGYENLHEHAVSLWKQGVKFHLEFVQEMESFLENKSKILSYVEKIQKYDLSFETPLISPPPGGCYIATAVYGSYDCPEVLVLRQYRDEVLSKSWYGRLFIHTYYTISPHIAKRLSRKSSITKFIKKKLDKFVSKLNS